MLKNKTKKEIPLEERECISAAEYASLDKEARKKWRPVDPRHEKIPLWSKIFLGIGAFCIIIYTISLFSVRFSDFFNLHISSFFRQCFAYISGIIPFSIAEMLLILLIPTLILIIRHFSKYRCDTWKTTGVSVICLLSVLSLFLSAFVLTFAPAYRGSSLEEKLDLETVEINEEVLFSSAVYLAQMANAEAEAIAYGEDDLSVMPYSFSEMNDKLIEAYDSFCEDYDFIKNFDSTLKPVMLSNAMSYTHITGIYTFFTGETNINMAFPDYTIPFTAAHELAHQRGIAREDEANMIAFLVCIRSSDPYIRYSGYLNMYEYVASALYSANKEYYSAARSSLDGKIKLEQAAYNKFFEKYSASTISKVSSGVNDVFLKSQGTEGHVSYSLVVELTVAYLVDENIVTVSEN